MKIGTTMNAEVQNVTDRMIHNVFTASADSFSEFLGKRVTFESLQNMSAEPVLYHLTRDEPLNLFISELRGDVKGTCFLVIPQRDCLEILKTQLSEEYLENGTLQDALLTKLDVIVTENFISVLKSELGLSTYTYIPKLKRGNKMELFSFLKSEEAHLQIDQRYKAVLKMEEVRVQPFFSWVLEEKAGKK